MTSEDSKKFFTILIGAAEVLGKGELSAIAQRMWFESLKSYDIKDVEQAFAREISNPDRKKFFPDPSDIVRQIEGTSSDKAMKAWNIVSKCGLSASDTAIFDDPIIHQVIEDMGGWISFNATEKWGRYEDADGNLHGYTDTQFNFFRKEFLDRYTALLKTGAPNAPNKLVGTLELENRQNYPEHVPQPIRITHEGKKLLPEWKPILSLPEPEVNLNEPIDVEKIKKQVKEFLEKPF